MPKTAKVFMNNRSQAVRLPREFQVNCPELFIRKEGDDIILSPRPANWSSYLAGESTASAGFMDEAGELPVQERSL